MTDTHSLVPVSESGDVYLVLDELPTFGGSPNLSNPPQNDTCGGRATGVRL